MAERGIIQRVAAKRGALYGKAPFVIGFSEAQVNRLMQRDVGRDDDIRTLVAASSGRRRRRERRGGRAGPACGRIGA